jgi:hypothetical protein
MIWLEDTATSAATTHVPHSHQQRGDLGQRSPHFRSRAQPDEDYPEPNGNFQPIRGRA